MSKIKLCSGWSNPGGSTTSHITLTNLLNDNGYDCTFYGPHDYHLDKCKSGRFEDFSSDAEDIIISHFVRFREAPKCKKHIFSCHEKDVWPINKMQESGRQDVRDYDTLHFVSLAQKVWQTVDHPHQAVIPPIAQVVDWTDPKNKVAGVIGSVDANKQTHISINRALNVGGYDKVLIFGLVTDPAYYQEYVSQFVDSGKAILAGHETNRKAMYAQISEVYHSSLSETYGLVEAECRLSGIPFNGTSNEQEILSEEEILEKWESVLK
jgi:hypothetical protein